MSVVPVRPPHASWSRSASGEEPAPLALAVALLPLVVAWTLPQTLAGSAFALWSRLRGCRGRWYRFGPFLFFVVARPPPFSRGGISLGAVVFAEDPSLLTHEFCHVYTALWLAWLYLPAYGLEYLLFGHDRSPHERATVRFERRCRRAWVRVGGGEPLERSSV